MPVTIPERKQVSLQDTQEVMTWIRLQQPVAYQPSEEFSFGTNQAREGTAPLRIVFANKVNLTDAENLVYKFVTAFPLKFSVSGYQFVFVADSLAVDPDHESIYTTELGNTVYEKHRFPWNLYAITFNIQFLPC
jgi:hypothetical protein